MNFFLFLLIKIYKMYYPKIRSDRMNKNLKSTNILLVFGCIFMFAGYYTSLAFLWNIMQYFVLGSTLETGLGVAFGLVLLWAPAVVLSIISLILNVVSYKKAIKPVNVWRKLALILAIGLPIVCLCEFIAICFV